MEGRLLRAGRGCIDVYDHAAFVAGADQIGLSIAIVVHFAKMESGDRQPLSGHVLPKLESVISSTQPNGRSLGLMVVVNDDVEVVIVIDVDECIVEDDPVARRVHVDDLLSDIDKSPIGHWVSWFCSECGADEGEEQYGSEDGGGPGHDAQRWVQLIWEIECR